MDIVEAIQDVRETPAREGFRAYEPVAQHFTFRPTPIEIEQIKSGAFVVLTRQASTGALSLAVKYHKPEPRIVTDGT